MHRPGNEELATTSVAAAIQAKLRYFAPLVAKMRQAVVADMDGQNGESARWVSAFWQTRITHTYAALAIRVDL